MTAGKGSFDPGLARCPPNGKIAKVEVEKLFRQTVDLPGRGDR